MAVGNTSWSLFTESLKNSDGLLFGKEQPNEVEQPKDVKVLPSEGCIFQHDSFYLILRQEK